MNRVKTAILTEIISPYRIPAFNCLAANPQIDLQVLFFSETEARRKWRVAKEKILFAYQVLEGFIVRWGFQNHPIFLNPTILIKLLRENYDCIIVSGYAHPTVWLTLIYARLFGKRCLIWSESTAKDQRSQNAIKEWFKHFLVRQASGYIVPGKAQFNYLVELGASSDRIWIAPNSVDSHFFAESARKLKSQKDQIKHELKLQGEVVLYVGRLLDEKGIPDLLNAFAKLDQELNLVHLVLVGDGSKQDKYVQECHDRNLKNTIFTGFQDQELLPKYYAIADIFAFPTHSDPWGLVLNEAMESGLPIVCSDAAGASSSLIEPNSNGFVYPAGDVAALTKLLATLVHDPELRRKMGERSSEIIRNYTPEEMAQGIAEAILNLTSSKPR
jgi:glycosyltransferase involved in cell wall biosynthesis